MINIDYDVPINDDAIIGWKSDRGWVYLTLLGVRAPKNKSTNKKSKVHRDKAIAWFFCSVGVTCDNFEQICNHAGLSPSYTRSFAYKVIHSPDLKYVRQRIKKML